MIQLPNWGSTEDGPILFYIDPLSGYYEVKRLEQEEFKQEEFVKKYYSEDGKLQFVVVEESL